MYEIEPFWRLTLKSLFGSYVGGLTVEVTKSHKSLDCFKKASEAVDFRVEYNPALEARS